MKQVRTQTKRASSVLLAVVLLVCAVLILSKEVASEGSDYKYILCQRQSDGRKSWVYADRVFEGTFGEYGNLKYAPDDGKKNTIGIY